MQGKWGTKRGVLCPTAFSPLAFTQQLLGQQGGPYPVCVCVWCVILCEYVCVSVSVGVLCLCVEGEDDSVRACVCACEMM
jgi:hypothetical protein